MTPQLRADLAVLAKVSDQATARRVIKRATYKRVNARRGDLIYADTPEDDPELVVLQEAVFRLVELAYPRPPMADLDALERRLTERHPDES